jgi:tetratricopeptide (TPR) repeat protein
MSWTAQVSEPAPGRDSFQGIPMIRICLAVLGLCIPGSALGDDKPKPAASPRERLATLDKEHKAAEAAFRKEAQALPDTPEGSQKYEHLWKAFDKGQQDRFKKAVELAQTDPKSDAALAALEWLLTIPRAIYLPPGKTGMELATQHQASNPKIGKIVAWVGHLAPNLGDNEAAAMALIKAVAEKNPDRTARGQALLALAGVAHSRFAVAEYQRKPDVDQLAAAAEQAFEAVLKDYADCPRLTRENAGTLGEICRAELFELRHLRVGKTAPDIEAEDLDSVKFKLSDYRGKVVVLDFWGDW